MARAVAVNPDLALALEGPVLSDRLDAAAWTVVAAAAQARGIRPADAARFRPWLLMMALSAPPCAAIPGRGGLDRMVLQAALAEGVAVAALEPWDTLFRLLGEGDEALQIEMLKLSLLDEGPAQELLVAMREGYFAGRVAEVWELSRLAARFRPEGLGHPDPQAFYRMEEALLDRRNAAWLPSSRRPPAPTPALSSPPAPPTCRARPASFGSSRRAAGRWSPSTAPPAAKASGRPRVPDPRHAAATSPIRAARSGATPSSGPPPRPCASSATFPPPRGRGRRDKPGSRR
jgi:hypothetical protein